MKLNIGFLLLILSIAACQGLPTQVDLQASNEKSDKASAPVWNASMQNLRKSLGKLEPYLFDKKKFNDPKNRSLLSKEIHQMAVESANVKHSPSILSKDPTVRFVAAQFAEELQKADENFSTGWQEFSRSQLVNVTSYCIECHTRLKDGPEFYATNSSESYLKTLPVQDRIELMIAFRQFEPAFNLALDTLKSIHANNSADIDAEQIAHLGLLIAVQYKQDVTKALRLSVVVENNKNLPLFLKEKSRAWKTSLAQWNPTENLQEISSIKKLIQRRQSEIEDMRAIAALLHFLTTDLTKDELGEGLLLTGERYESLNKIALVTLHENYYESCVRQVPHTKWAKLCFNKLSESVAFGYTGSSGTHIPADIKTRMQELKKLIE